MKPILAVLILACGCATTHSTGVLATTPGLFGARDYLKTAWETLGKAETDTEGHRIRAERETRAALEELGDVSMPARRVPFSGAPSLAVALELLEHSEIEMSRMCSNDALVHTRRAASELRAAIASK